MCRRFNVLCFIWFTCSFWISIINPLNTETDHQSFSALEDELKLNDSLTWNVGRSKIKNRRQRSIWQLYEVITCITPCNPFVLKDYGCYCGLGGTGRPVDPIDKCCMLHDYCYHRTPCHQTLTYFLPYDWVCVSGRPVCSIPLRWSAANACSVQLCECDRMFSECLNTVGCPKYKAVCKTDHFRHMWQKILIQFWNRMFR